VRYRTVPGKRSTSATPLRISTLRMPVIDTYPLSPLQQGMLFHALRDPRAGQDIEQVVVTLHGSVDVGAMRAAWQLVVDRHDVLRTSFRWEGLDEPVQDVHDAVAVPLEVREPDAGEDAPDRLAHFLTEDRRRGFDPAHAPLLRITILAGERASHVVWTQHHGVVDGLSMRIVLREAMAAYDALRAGEAVVLPPAAMPYRDFIEWRGRLDEGASREYWRELLAGFAAPAPIPVAHAPAAATATSSIPGGGAGRCCPSATSRSPRPAHARRESASAPRSRRAARASTRVTRLRRGGRATR